MKKKSCSYLLCFLICGCNISFPQLESASKLIQNTVLEEKSDSEAGSRSVWVGSVGGIGAVLSPYSAEDLTIFANADGDAVAFDGWTLRSITGFGLPTPISISGKTGVRRFVFNGQVFETFCSAWTWNPPVWRQRCANGPSIIELNDSGEIQNITMTLGGNAGVVELRLVK